MLDMGDGESRELRDPQEHDPQLRPIIRTAAREAQEALRSEGLTPQLMGYCHLLWDCQKGILKKKYGIDWKSPAEMNPNIMYD